MGPHGHPVEPALPFLSQVGLEAAFDSIQHLLTEFLVGATVQGSGDPSRNKMDENP